MRELGFKVAGRDDALWTFSIIEGSGGGLAANVNRWRRQMSLPPAGDDEIAALPRRDLLGEEAVEVDLRGRYVGMGGGPAIEDARMVGLIVSLEQVAAFVKLVGPADVVTAELEHHEGLISSLRPPGAPGGDLPPDHPPVGAAGPVSPDAELPPGHPPMAPGAMPSMPAAPTPSSLKWTAPASWKEQPPKPMREVTFRPEGAKDTECYVTILSGRAGGVPANLNRWRQQMGKPDLTEDEIAALPKAHVLGGDGVFLAIAEGDFTGDMGSDVQGAAMLGFVVERASDSVFVKMLGPASEVLPERDNFESFCRSLSE